MSNYPSAGALIADAHFRLDGLDASGARLGILVVEGPDDKRLFYHRVLNPAQILPAGGQRLLLAAYAAASPSDHDRILFITDCDYSVRLGELSGGHGLVITSGTDVESDLLTLGLLRKIVTEIAPSALSVNQVEKVAAEALSLAVSLALPLGRIRMASRPLGVDLGFEDIDFSKYWRRGERTLDEEKLIRVCANKLRAEACSADLKHLVSQTPDDAGMCHGKDLLSALRTILLHEYRVDAKVTVDILRMMLHIALDDASFNSWTVTSRMRTWAAKTGSTILRES